MWIGASEHHRPFGGTVSLNPTLYVQVLCTILRNLIGDHKRILLLNSHGGNDAPMRTALAEIAAEAAAQKALVNGITYWHLAEAAWEKEVDGLENSRMGHADDLETSMMLALHPEAVQDPGPASPFPLIQEEVGTLALPFDHLTNAGHMGDPGQSTVRKGEKILDVIAEQIRLHLAKLNRLTFPSSCLPQ